MTEHEKANKLPSYKNSNLLYSSESHSTDKTSSYTQWAVDILILLLYTLANILS